MEYRFNGISEHSLTRLKDLVSESEIEITRETHIIKVGNACFTNEIITCILTPHRNTKIVVIVFEDEVIVYRDFKQIVRIKNNEYASLTVM